MSKTKKSNEPTKRGFEDYNATQKKIHELLLNSKKKYRYINDIAKDLDRNRTTISKNIRTMSTVEKINKVGVMLKGEKSAKEKLCNQLKEKKFKNYTFHKNVKIAIIACEKLYRNDELTDIICKAFEEGIVWVEPLNKYDIIIYYTEEISMEVEHILEQKEVPPEEIEISTELEHILEQKEVPPEEIEISMELEHILEQKEVPPEEIERTSN